jgi:hypothetical protein
MFFGTVCSSLVASVICTPFDVVKSRLQQMPAALPGQPPLYRGMSDCFSQGLKAEGPAFLYRGFTPAFVKLAPYTTISFLLTEKLMALVTGKHAF